MEKTDLMNFTLSEIADGAVQEKFGVELAKVATNILDVNTNTKDKRRITIDLTFSPNDNRDAVDVMASVRSKLAPQIGVSTTMLVGRDLKKGVTAVNELKSGTIGQTYIDDQGEVRTDIGQPISEIEAAQKVNDSNQKQAPHEVIDFQKQSN